MGFDDYPMAYYFDRAVGLFGVHLENAIAEAESKGKTANSKAMKKKMVLARYLGADAAGFAKGPSR